MQLRINLIFYSNNLAKPLSLKYRWLLSSPSYQNDSPTKFFIVDNAPKSFQMSIISSIYKIKTHQHFLLGLLIHTWFIRVLFKIKRFDCLIKMNVPTLRGLLKFINGPMQLAYHILLVFSYKNVW